MQTFREWQMKHIAISSWRQLLHQQNTLISLGLANHHCYLGHKAFRRWRECTKTLTQLILAKREKESKEKHDRKCKVAAISYQMDHVIHDSLSQCSSRIGSKTAYKDIEHYDIVKNITSKCDILKLNKIYALKCTSGSSNLKSKQGSLPNDQIANNVRVNTCKSLKI